jgi:hypothetical protein
VYLYFTLSTYLHGLRKDNFTFTLRFRSTEFNDRGCFLFWRSVKQFGPRNSLFISSFTVVFKSDAMGPISCPICNLKQRLCLTTNCNFTVNVTAGFLCPGYFTVNYTVTNFVFVVPCIVILLSGKQVNLVPR